MALGVLDFYISMIGATIFSFIPCKMNEEGIHMKDIYQLEDKRKFYCDLFSIYLRDLNYSNYIYIEGFIVFPLYQIVSSLPLFNFFIIKEIDRFLFCCLTWFIWR